MASKQVEQPAANPPPLPPRRLLAQMLVGNQIQQAIYVAAKLGIADLLKSGPKRSEELAQTTGAHADALYRLLRALTGFGIFTQDEHGRFDLTPVSALLESGTPSCAFALWTGNVSYQVFGSLEYSIRTGKPAFDHLFGMEFFEYLSQHPDIGSLFDQLMSWHTAPVAPAVAAYDLSGVHTLVDLGGGRGELLSAILGAHPTMHGVLVDQSRAVEAAQSVLKAAGVAERCRTICGNILEGILPGGDAYILKSVVHGLSDEQAVRLLQNCQRSMNRGGKILLVEFVMPPGNEPFPGKLMDLLMLIGGPGRERTKEEFTELFAKAGFQLTNIETTRYAYSIIEGRPA